MVENFQIQQLTKKCFTLIEPAGLFVDLLPFKSNGSITNEST